MRTCLPTALPASTTQALSRRAVLGGGLAATLGLAVARPADAASPLTVTRALAYATTWVGVTPYVWGGTDLVRGADCSGFTLRVFEKVGLRLPRTAAQQRAAVPQVSRERLALGDLVFFHDGPVTDARNVSHVGIYAGGGEIVDASASKGRVVRRRIWSANVSYGSLRATRGGRRRLVVTT